MSEIPIHSAGEVSRTYVKVRADHQLDGSILPVKFRTEDGPTVTIDEVRDMRRAASTRAGGQGWRYTCRAGEHMYYLFHDRDRWYVEALES